MLKDAGILTHMHTLKQSANANLDFMWVKLFFCWTLKKTSASWTLFSSGENVLDRPTQKNCGVNDYIF